MYETLQSIVDQLEYCDYQTKDDLHELKMNAAFIALKERAAAESCGSKTDTSPNNTRKEILLCGINNSICKYYAHACLLSSECTGQRKTSSVA